MKIKHLVVLFLTWVLVVATIPVGAAPGDVALDPSGAVAYVSSNATASVSVIDTASGATMATVPIGFFTADSRN